MSVVRTNMSEDVFRSDESTGGFGYDDEANLEMIEGDNLVPLMVIQKELEELYNFFKDKPLEDTRILIEWLMMLLED